MSLLPRTVLVFVFHGVAPVFVEVRESSIFLDEAVVQPFLQLPAFLRQRVEGYLPCVDVQRFRPYRASQKRSEEKVAAIAPDCEVMQVLHAISQPPVLCEENEGLLPGQERILQYWEHERWGIVATAAAATRVVASGGFAPALCISLSRKFLRLISFFLVETSSFGIESQPERPWVMRHHIVYCRRELGLVLLPPPPQKHSSGEVAHPADCRGVFENIFHERDKPPATSQGRRARCNKSADREVQIRSMIANYHPGASLDSVAVPKHGNPPIDFDCERKQNPPCIRKSLRDL
mmetsp:Transcript_23525/g.37931  ORF Transcript_23525/g.37931 Transcript_23525/m.37931 type:complete len:292 (-) Transcript_23525:207-1082(-)